MESQVNDNLLKFLPDDDTLSQCIHCGMCLAVCPTYELTHLERSSPRGRIKLIKAVVRHELPITNTFKYEMNFCLDCQACETACPAGVKYGSMVEASRSLISEAESSRFQNRMKRFLLNTFIGSKIRLKIAARFFYVYENFGIRKFLNSVGFFKIMPNRFKYLEEIAPIISKTFSDTVLPEIVEPEGEVKYKTAFLIGCLMNVIFSEENIDTVEVLKRTGSRIFIPKEQVCCGSLHAHSGEIEYAKKLARHTIDSFPKGEYDFLVCNSAGCAAFMKEYVHVFKDDPYYAEKARIFSAKVKEFSEFTFQNLQDIKFEKLNEEITYHDPCHLVHTQKISKEPRKIFQSIPELKLVEMEESTWCCGSAGIYNIMQMDSSLSLLERKMNHIKNTNAKVVVTGNPGCIAQLRFGAKKFKVDVEVVHPATIILGSLNKKN